MVAEADIDGGGVAGIDGGEEGELFVGIGDEEHVIDKPGVAHRPRVLHGHGLAALQGQDGVLGVEHVQHGEEAVAGDAVEASIGLGDGFVEGRELRLDVGFDELLVAAQLGGVVAADALVPVGGGVVVEGVHGEVHDAVVEVAVLQDGLVGGCLLEELLCGLGLGEHGVVEVALVDIPHIGGAEHEEAGYHDNGVANGKLRVES